MRSEPASAGAPWVERLTKDVVIRLIGRSLVNDAYAFGPPLTYASAPFVTHGGTTVVASIAGRSRRDTADVFVEIQPYDRIRTGCNCHFGRYGTCHHVHRFLADIVISDDLRDALAKGYDTADAIDAIEEAREAFAQEERLRADLDAWVPPRAVVDDVLVAAEAVDSGYSHRGHENEIQLRLRRRSERALIDPRDIDRLELPRDVVRLVAFTDPHDISGKAFVARGASAALLIAAMREHGGVLMPHFKGLLAFSEAKLSPRIVATPEPHSIIVETSWDRSDRAAPFDADDVRVFPGPVSFAWVRSAKAFYEIDGHVDASSIVRMNRRPIAVPRHRATSVGAVIFTRARGKGIALPPREVFGLPALETPDFALRIDGSPLDLSAELEAVYSDKRVRVTGQVADDSTRDEQTEAAALAAVKAAGFAIEGDALVAGEDAAVTLWQRGIAELRASASPRFEVLLSDRLAAVSVRGPVKSTMRVTLEGGWLDARLDFAADAVKVEMEAVRAALANKRRWVELGDGTLARIGAEVEALVVDATGVLDDDGKGRLAPHHLGRIDAWADLAEADLDEGVSALRARLRALAVTDVPELPRALRAELRPYQARGLAWLQFLRELGAGGILADDMGLGKTLMTLALALACKEREKEHRPSLVVCPTSVAGNWVREAARFTPDLRVVLLHGEGRDASAVAGADLVVTTYAILRRDIDALSSHEWRLFVLDEAQNVKNDSAQTTHAARRIRATTRLALSGTPVENRLRELWSIMQIVNPGMLGTARDFEQRYERPVAEDAASIQRDRLRRAIRPFVLRRTKDEVLSELPPKTEVERTCSLTPPHKRLYDGLAHALREDVRDRVARDGLAKTRLTIFTALLRLRQMACDPRLVDPKSKIVSAKRAAFLDIVRELAAEGRRALVFSQFVELLTLWRADLDEARIAYEYLDGSTTKRDAVVDRFQRGSAPLFLISLKAGGAGLNLTAADTVIHCDPWWNPAVEDQATDRAHRIGQHKPVTVVRLLARGTIEDKIASLKKKKRAIADAVIGTDGGGALRGLTEEDLRELLGDAEDDHQPPRSGGGDD